MEGERFELEKPATDALPMEPAGQRPRYPSPIEATSLYGYGYGERDQKVHLRDLWRTVRKRKTLILTLALIVTTLVTIEMYRTKSVFESTATIEIGKDSAALSRPGAIVYQDDFDPFYLVNIKTRMLMLTSQSLLEDVVISERLDERPEFLAVTGKQSTWEALKLIGSKFIPKGNAGDEEQTPAEVETFRSSAEPATERTAEESRRLQKYVTIIAANLNVQLIRDTRAIRVTFTHTDPKIAASVTNAIARTFLQRNYETKTERFTRTAKWLDTSTRELKAKVEQSQQALADYTRTHNIFSTDGKDATLTTDKLTRLHDQVMRAEHDRMVKQSLFEEVKAGRVKQLPEAFADMVYKSAPKMVELQKQLGELEAQSAELNVKYGPDNPRLMEVEQRIAAIRSQIESNSKSLEDKLKSDYDRAIRDEQALRGSLDQAKTEAVKQNQDSIQLNILKQEVETANSLYTDFLQKTNQAKVQVAEQQNNIKIIEPARIPGSPAGPRRFRTILIALCLSLMAGVGLAFFLDYLDNTIKTVDDVARYAQLPALSVIPAMAGSSSRRLASRNGSRKAIPAGDNGSAGKDLMMQTHNLVALDARSSGAEAYRVLRTSVLLSAAGNPPKTILVTSGQPSEGKTTTVVNTAISLAQLGASVLIIDCDLRRPSVHKALGLDPSNGVSTFLSRDVELDELIQKLQIPNLSVIPSGPIPPNPAELISSEKMRAMLADLTQRYDHVLIDSPPLINVTDPVILSTMVDGVILVVHGGKSTREVVRRARHELSSVGAKIFGVVLNNVDLRRDGSSDYYYYHRYYSGYHKDESAADGQSV